MTKYQHTPHGDFYDMSEHAMKVHSDTGFRIDTHRPIPGCSGPCDQGRKPCPCPSECHIKLEEIYYSTPYDGLAGVGAIAIPAIILCVILAGYILHAAGVW